MNDGESEVPSVTVIATAGAAAARDIGIPAPNEKSIQRSSSFHRHYCHVSTTSTPEFSLPVTSQTSLSLPHSPPPFLTETKKRLLFFREILKKQSFSSRKVFLCLLKKKRNYFCFFIFFVFDRMEKALFSLLHKNKKK